jgi:glycosyltransferase involved in cell wall biosynthesis
VTEALFLLQKEERLPPLRIDFTGAEPDAAINDLKLSRLTSVDAHFLGRVEGFRDLLRQYDLVVVPSRMECFGTAAMETLAAGVPLLSTQTGAVVSVLSNIELLVPPARPDLLAAALRNIFERWSEIDFGVEAAQEEIRRRYLIDHAAERLDAIYGELTHRSRPAEAVAPAHVATS